MNRLGSPFLFVFLLVSPLAAQTRAQLTTTNNTYYYTNGTNAITGAGANTVTQDLINGMGVLGDANTWTGSNTFGGSTFLTGMTGCLQAGSAGVVTSTGHSCGTMGSSIIAGQTATSGFTAGQFLYSDGTYVQPSPELTISNVGTVTMTQTDNDGTLLSNNPMIFVDPQATNLGLQIWAGADEGQPGPITGYIAQGADSLAMWKGYNWSTILGAYMNQIGSQEQDGIYLGQAGMQFFQMPARNYPGTATITHASPAVVTLAANYLDNTQLVYFTTTGTLPAPLVVNTAYCVAVAAADTIELESWDGSVCGGTPINTTTNGTGTHTLYAAAPLTLTACVGSPYQHANCLQSSQPHGAINGAPEWWFYSPAQFQNQVLINNDLYMGFPGGTQEYIAFSNGFSNASNNYVWIGAQQGVTLGNGTIYLPALTGSDTFATLGLAETFTGAINFTGGISSNSNAGVTCAAGNPTSSFATNHGIVIHC